MNASNKIKVAKCGAMLKLHFFLKNNLNYTNYLQIND